MSDERPRSMLGAFIRQQRELSQMSMRQMSKLVGISNPYLSQIERGLRAPSATVTAAIAGTLGFSVEELYERSGAGTPAQAAVTRLRTAIEQATELTPMQRSALLNAYETFVAANQPKSPPASDQGATDG